MDDERTKSTLKQVAQALGISEDVFLKDRSSPSESPVPDLLERLELLRVFSEITDPEARRSCLEYARSFATPADMAAG